MTDLTSKLAELVREHQAREAELEQLGERARAGEDTAELEERLGVEAELAAAAFEPLSEATEARFAAAIQGSLAAPASGVARRRLGPVLWLGPALAAAALVALWLWPAGLPLLEPYELEVSGAVALERGVQRAPAPLGLAPSSSLVLLLRPEHAPERELTARVFLHAGAGELPLPTSLERSPSGVLKLRVELAADLPAAGELVVLVGVPELLGDPQVAARLLASKAPSGPGWQRATKPFTRAAAPGAGGP